MWCRLCTIVMHIVMHIERYASHVEDSLRTITIRKMPRDLEQRIETIAAEEGSSLARTVIRLLMRATGLRESELSEAGEQRHHDLDDLAGTWSDEEAAEFDRSVAGQRRVDPEVWG